MEHKSDKEILYNLVKFLASSGGRLLLTVVFAAAIYSVLFVTLETENMFVLGCLLAGCGYFGWVSLNKITPALFIWMPLGAWAVYLFVKGFLSIIIGAFVAPVWLGRKISSGVMNLLK